MSTYYNKGDAIEGERIIAETQKIGKKEIIQKSKQHRGTRLKLEKWAFCVIDRPVVPIRNKK